MGTLLDLLRKKKPMQAQAGLNVGNVDQFLGSLLAQYFQQLQLGEGQLYNQIANTTGYMPSAWADMFDTPTASTKLAFGQLDESKRQADMVDAFNRLQLEESSKNQALDRQLTREVEMGRLSLQQKQLALQEAQIASQERIENAKLELQRMGIDIEKYRADTDRQRAETEKLLGTRELDLAEKFGIRTQDREDYMARLQGANLEYDMAANPRDFIKLAYARKNQIAPTQLKGLSGTSNIKIPRLDKGGVVEGPAISTVGERGLEYALLPPGSIVAPKTQANEEPNMANAIRAIIKQVLESGGQAPKGMADGGIVRERVAPPPGGTQPPTGGGDSGNKGNTQYPNFPFSQAQQLLAAIDAGGRAGRGGTEVTVQQLMQQLQTLLPFQTYKHFYKNGVFDLNILRTYLTTYSVDPDAPPVVPTPTGPPDPDAWKDPGTPTGDLSWLADIPQLKDLRSMTSPTNYPGIEKPFGSTVKPINPYNPHVGFALGKMGPTDLGMFDAYQSAFGIPEGDTQTIAAQTVQGFKPVASNTRTMLRPFFAV